MITSIIVQKFYSRCEKLGLKQHKVTQEEVDFLEEMSDIEQCKAFCDEADYNITLLNNKIRISLLSALLLTVTATILFIFQFYWWFLITFLGIGFLLVLSKIFKNKIDIHKFQKVTFGDVKEHVLSKNFR